MRRACRPDGAFFGPDVEELVTRVNSRLSQANRQLLGYLGIQAQRLVEVAGNDSLLRTDDNTCRLQPHLRAVGAIVALGGRIAFGVDVDGVVRAGLHAGFASDATVGVEIHNAVRTLVHGRNGADGDARRILTMIATSHLKVA